MYILRDKEVKTILRVLQEYWAWAEKQTGYEIKAIRTDGGTEYRKEMEWALVLGGIEPQKTAPHTPQSNGVSERMNRTLMDMVGPMLEGARLKLSHNALGRSSSHSLLHQEQIANPIVEGWQNTI